MLVVNKVLAGDGLLIHICFLNGGIMPVLIYNLFALTFLIHKNVLLMLYSSSVLHLYLEFHSEIWSGLSDRLRNIYFLRLHMCIQFIDINVVWFCVCVFLAFILEKEEKTKLMYFIFWYLIYPAAIKRAEERRQVHSTGKKC